MWWMIGFWVSLILAWMMYSLNKKYPNKHFKDWVGLFFVYSIIFFIIAIATKDPIFQAIGLPAGYEWLAGTGILGFVGWKSYLNPLKERVIKCEHNVGVTKTKIENIEKILDEFRPYILKKK